MRLVTRIPQALYFPITMSPSEVKRQRFYEVKYLKILKLKSEVNENRTKYRFGIRLRHKAR
jgi:hypothetical protein